MDATKAPPSSAARLERAESARRRARAAEVQAVAIMWLGVASAVLGVVALIALRDKAVAGSMTFGGAGVVLVGLLRGAYGQYRSWRGASG